jgi:hypothetical protein
VILLVSGILWSLLMLAAVVWALVSAIKARFGLAQVCALAVIVLSVVGAYAGAARLPMLALSLAVASTPVFVAWRRKATLPVGASAIEQAESVSSPFLLIAILDAIVLVPVVLALLTDRS